MEKEYGRLFNDHLRKWIWFSDKATSKIDGL
jgi:hypothetical protein